MKDRIFMLNILALCIVTLFLVGGIYAYFTSSTATTSNLFQTGTVTIGTEPTTAAFNVQSLAPGRSESATIRVNNGGNLDLNYRVTAEKKRGYSTVFNALNARVTDSAGQSILYDGPLSALETSAIPLGAGQGQDLNFIVGLPAEGGNDLQNDYCVVDFVFTGEQAH